MRKVLATITIALAGLAGVACTVPGGAEPTDAGCTLVRQAVEENWMDVDYNGGNGGQWVIGPFTVLSPQEDTCWVG